MKRPRTLALCAIILLALIFPLLIGDTLLTSLAVTVLLLTGVAVAWNIFSGYTGYISLGHATYYGIGAYALALICSDWSIPGGYGPVLLFPLVGLITAACSVPLGWIALRTRRYTFIIVTIAIFFIFQMLAHNLRGITNGADGLYLPSPTLSADFYNVPFYYMALALLLAVAAVSWWIRHSRFGLILLAIRDDEERARGLGVRVEWYKLGAYALSAAFTGMIGALSVYFAGLVTPSYAFDQTFDITIVTLVFFGGIGSVAGPIIGGLVLVPLQAYLNQQYGPGGTGLNLILFGCFLLAVILLLPEGVVPTLSRRWQMWNAVRRTRAREEMAQPSSAEAAEADSLEPVRAPALSEDPVQRIPLEEEANSIASSVLLHLGEQARVLPLSLRVAKKVRLIRLEPLDTLEALESLESLEPEVVPVDVQEEMRVPAAISWRCPRCGKPFLLSGTTCYCPRCGFTRSLSEGMQAISFTPEPEYPGSSQAKSREIKIQQRRGVEG